MECQLALPSDTISEVELGTTSGKNGVHDVRRLFRILFLGDANVGQTATRIDLELKTLGRSEFGVKRTALRHNDPPFQGRPLRRALDRQPLCAHSPL
jgi:hypothetical protein